MNIRKHLRIKILRKDEPMKLSLCVDEFLKAKKLSISPNTYRDYELTLNRARVFFDTDPEFCDITPGQISDFLITIPGGLKNKLNAYVGLSSMYTWAVKRGIVEEHVMRMIEQPKPPDTIILPFNEDEIVTLFEDNGRLEKRNRAMMFFLLDTGARASEVGNCRLSDIRDGFIRVMGKGRKERLLPISARTWKALLDYFEVREIKQAKWLFTTTTGKQMDRCAVYHNIHRIGERQGVLPCYTHRFRHTFAVQYLLNGGDPFTLRRIMGHTTMEMVDRYLEFVSDDLRRVHHRASPVANIDFERKNKNARLEREKASNREYLEFMSTYSSHP